eukprot:TRINITY_DN1602_c0_g1_i2.p1 TRINITY_DN1602_c0_g1~~TRINITY_DN1602_c0_g1_i2.p1  ORF type:complete len:108 (+),score=43.14 TRINITY_DN1602_c0_g1_i2:273-596(+)
MPARLDGISFHSFFPMSNTYTSAKWLVRKQWYQRRVLFFFFFFFFFEPRGGEAGSPTSFFTKVELGSDVRGSDFSFFFPLFFELVLMVQYFRERPSVIFVGCRLLWW